MTAKELARLYEVLELLSKQNEISDVVKQNLVYYEEGQGAPSLALKDAMTAAADLLGIAAQIYSRIKSLQGV